MSRLSLGDHIRRENTRIVRRHDVSVFRLRNASRDLLHRCCCVRNELACAGYKDVDAYLAEAGTEMLTTY